LLYSGPLLCGFNVTIKGLIESDGDVFVSVTESKKAQQEMRKSAVDAARIQKKVKKGEWF